MWSPLQLFDEQSLFISHVSFMPHVGAHIGAMHWCAVLLQLFDTQSLLASHGLFMPHVPAQPGGTHWKFWQFLAAQSPELPHGLGWSQLGEQVGGWHWWVVSSQLRDAQSELASHAFSKPHVPAQPGGWHSKFWQLLEAHSLELSHACPIGHPGSHVGAVQR